jgi:hypothetical protein
MARRLFDMVDTVQVLDERRDTRIFRTLAVLSLLTPLADGRSPLAVRRDWASSAVVLRRRESPGKRHDHNTNAIADRLQPNAMS